MEPPRHYSVSPLHSFITVPSHRAPSLIESLRAIAVWWRPKTPTLRERQLEAALVERLAAEIEIETSLNGAHSDQSETSLTPLPPKRPRRIEDPR
jgi:hypothetical protein